MRFQANFGKWLKGNEKSLVTRIREERESGMLRWKLPVLGALIVFVLLAAWNVDLPGLYYDELTQVQSALRFVKGDAYRSQAEGIGQTEIAIRGHRLPLMAMGYVGAVKSIAFVPLAATVPLGPRSIRYLTIAIGALGLIATAAFARRLIGPTAAAVGIVLLAIDPSYLIFSRTDYGATGFMSLLKGVALWQLIIWWQTRKSWPLYVAAFAMGLGVYDKANFLWIVVGLAAAAIVIAPGSLARLTRKQAVYAACLFVIGCLPLVIYNFRWPPPTWTALEGQNRIVNNERGLARSSKELERRLAQRTQSLTGLFTATTVPWIRGCPAPRLVVMPALVLASSVITLVCYATPRLRRRWRREMLLLLTTLFILLFAVLTPGGYTNHHLLLAYGFPHLLVAAVLVRSVRWLYQMGTPLGAMAAAAVFCLGFAGPVTASLLRYRQIMVKLQKTGGTLDWSDAIYRLDSWLETHDADEPVVAVDWGIAKPLAVLSQGQLDCADLWWFPKPADYQRFFNRPGARYVMHTPSDTHFPDAREVFLKAVQDDGLQLQPVKIFNDRTAHPVLLVYVLTPKVSG